MKADVKKIEDLLHELTVEVPAETVNKELESRFAKIKSETTLQGYRKGKAPINVIKSNFGDQVRVEVAEELIKSTYSKVVQDNSLAVATPPKVTHLDYTDEGNFTYTARVEVFPVIEEVKYSDLEVVSQDVEVQDDEVQEFSDSLLKRAATTRTLAVPATVDHIVVADMKKTYDPKLVIEETDFPESILDLSNPATIKEFREKVPGMKAGDEKEIEIKYDDDYSDEKFAGAVLKYTVKVKEVQERILPEFDDVFAKSTGQAETALELRMKIRGEIQRQKADQLQKMQRQQIVQSICEANPISVPGGLIDDYIDRMVEDLKSKNEKFDEAEVRKTYRPLGENSIRWSMLMHKLIGQEKIEVLATDTEKLIKSFSENYGIPEDQAKQYLAHKDRADNIRESILEEKVLDFLLTKAKMVPADTKKGN